VFLRDVVEADLPMLFANESDPVAREMAAFPARDRATFMALWATILANPEITSKAIVVDEQVAGGIVCFDHDGAREVGYWIGREFWGRGFATEAVTALLKIETTRPLHAGVAPHNAGSLRVLEKCGFVRVGQDDHFITLVLET
jgi:RimJ/RimL family protein N-acetyltransferase